MNKETQQIWKSSHLQTHLSWLVLTKVYFLDIQRVGIWMLLDRDDLAYSDVQHVDCGLIIGLLGSSRGFLAFCFLLLFARRILHIDSLTVAM